MKAELVFATRNGGKLAELEDLVGEVVRVRSLADFPDAPEVEETGATFEENAALKAEAIARATGRFALADDSGLCVDALGGAPGVHSARYAPGADRDRVAKLLGELRGVPPPRPARFVCVLALASPEGRLTLERGEVEGEIALEPRGGAGFGYDPVFLVPSLGRTLAELTREEKGRISHRGEAFRRMRPHLIALASGGSGGRRV